LARKLNVELQPHLTLLVRAIYVRDHVCKLTIGICDSLFVSQRVSKLELDRHFDLEYSGSSRIHVPKIPIAAHLK
jgi:hypothetical protein